MRTETIEREEWLEVAKRVNAGRFDRAMNSEVNSLLIGLRTWNDGEFWHAKRRLNARLKSA